MSMNGPGYKNAALCIHFSVTTIPPGTDQFAFCWINRKQRIFPKYSLNHLDYHNPGEKMPQLL